MNRCRTLRTNDNQRGSVIVVVNIAWHGKRRDVRIPTESALPQVVVATSIGYGSKVKNAKVKNATSQLIANVNPKASVQL